MHKLSSQLYFGFWAGFVLAVLLLSYFLVNSFVSKDIFKHSTVYIDNTQYNICKKSCK